MTFGLTPIWCKWDSSMTLVIENQERVLNPRLPLLTINDAAAYGHWYMNGASH